LGQQAFFQKKINLKYEDTLQANRRVGRHIRAGVLFKSVSFLIFVGVFGIYMVVSTLLIDALNSLIGEEHGQVFSIGLILLLIILMVVTAKSLFYFSYIRLGARNLRKLRREGTAEFSVGEQGIDAEWSGVAIKVDWESIVSLIECPNYVGISVGFFEIVMPDRVFTDAEERQKVVAYALAHMTEDAARRSVRKR